MKLSVGDVVVYRSPRMPLEAQIDSFSERGITIITTIVIDNTNVYFVPHDEVAFRIITKADYNYLDNKRKTAYKERERILTEKSLLDGSFKKAAKELNKLFGEKNDSPV